MARSSLMAASSLVVLILLVVPCVFGTDHTVGGSSGWTLSSVDYGTWASGNSFTVGDNLVFNYDSTHGVDIVNENGYTSCSSSNALKTYSGGSTKIPLTTAGKMYFICPTSGHCGNGMKLSINVVAAGSTPATPTTPSTPKSPSTPTTPSTTSSNTTSPPPPSGSGAVGGLGGVKELMGSLVVSLLILALMC